MLLNIDKPHRTATLHNESCSFIPSPLGSPYKPIEQLGRDGGWFSLATEAEARSFASMEFPHGEFVRCQNC